MTRLSPVAPPSTLLRFLGLFGMLAGGLVAWGYAAALLAQLLPADGESNTALLFGVIFTIALLLVVGPVILLTWIFGAGGADRLHGRWIEVEGTRLSAATSWHRYGGAVTKRQIGNGPFAKLEARDAVLRATRPDGSRLILSRFYRDDTGALYELRLREERLVPERVERLEVIRRVRPGPWRVC